MMSPARESAHVGRQPWAFSSHPEFQILPLPETELRKVVGLTPVGSTRGSFLRLCLYHSVNNMIFHLKITRLKLFTIFIYVILRRSFAFRILIVTACRKLKQLNGLAYHECPIAVKIRRLQGRPQLEILGVLFRCVCLCYLLNYIFHFIFQKNSF